MTLTHSISVIIHFSLILLPKMHWCILYTVKNIVVSITLDNTKNWLFLFNDFTINTVTWVKILWSFVCVCAPHICFTPYNMRLIFKYWCTMCMLFMDCRTIKYLYSARVFSRFGIVSDWITIEEKLQPCIVTFSFIILLFSQFAKITSEQFYKIGFADDLSIVPIMVKQPKGRLVSIASFVTR